MGESMLQYLQRQTQDQIEFVLGKKLDNIPDVYIDKYAKGIVFVN